MRLNSHRSHVVARDSKLWLNIGKRRRDAVQRIVLMIALEYEGLHEPGTRREFREGCRRAAGP
jgi:hypothetical protein